MATSPQPRMREVPEEEPELQIAQQPRTTERLLPESAVEREAFQEWMVMENRPAGRILQSALVHQFDNDPAFELIANLRDQIQEGELAGENVNLTMREYAAQRAEFSPEVEAHAEAFTARYGNNVGEFLSKDEPAEDRVQMLYRGRELTEQEQFETPSAETRWTLQQYGTTPAGEPWFALQKDDEAGETRTITGTREELAKVAADHGLTPLELPPAREGSYYREAVGSLQLSPEIRREEGLSVGV